jgi:hypothetical protein
MFPTWFHRYIVTGSSTHRQRVLKALASLTLAFSFWFILMLDRSYETTLICPLAIEHVPEDILFTQVVQTEARVRVEGRGTALLRKQLSTKRDTLSLDFEALRKADGQTVLLTEEALPEMRRNLPNGITPVRIQPEVIALAFEKRSLPVATGILVQTLLELPIRTVHLPTHTEVRYSHPQVIVSCNVPADRVEALRKDYTEILVDYATLDTSQAIIIPEIVLPPYARIVSREPLEVSYTIQEQ